MLAALASCDDATRTQLADALGEQPEGLGYSIKVLMESGLVEEARTEPAANFVERFFGLTDLGRLVYATLLALLEAQRVGDGLPDH